MSEAAEQPMSEEDRMAAEWAAALAESKGDLEADMLIEAICRMDAASKSLRPLEAKDGAFTGFTLPAKALRSIIPASAPTNSNRTTVPIPASSNPPQQPTETPKASERSGEMLYVPRALFILDVRMNETPAKSAK